MKKSILTLMLMVAMLPLMANAYEQLADGVYQDGSTLYIGSGVTSLGGLQVNPSVIYCYATIPPACVANTFTGYGATLHVPTAAMVNYFSAQYWYNFSNVMADAVEPLSLTLNHETVSIAAGEQFHVSASITPTNATPKNVSWYSTNSDIAIVSGGLVTTVAPGESDIIAHCATLQAVCHVTVTSPRVTITLDKHEARVLPNHLLTLTATCSPIPTDLIVISSDNSIAMPRLVNGLIQVLGLKEGMATITVGSVDGNANTDTCQVAVYTEVGDMDSDGYVDISDVTELIDFLLTDNSEGISTFNADTDRDGIVNISDVTMLIDYLLGAVDLNPPRIETFTVNGVSFNMVEVQGGTFMMGASYDDTEANSFEKPAHQVTLSSFSIGQTEVTQALWVAVMGSNPSYFTSAIGYTDDLTCPVDNVSWTDCQMFISKLNELTGMNFRLPTEAEWEYAARGGHKSQGYKYSGSNNVDDVAWCYDNLPSQSMYTQGCRPQPVANKNPNELGLYDMSGNLYEWCQDWYDAYYYSNSPLINPTGPTSGTERVIRGGGWDSGGYGKFCRVTFRTHQTPSVAYIGGPGLRLAL